ncbi:MAG: Peptide methionine sulfoxide reductase MsrB (EC / Peptide methionine sulfoxide reductase MsrA (EC [uncultured Sulfurovum sp.]|uniref:Peptide methionine sulfoxide reductase MsrA n=1 Tax=uncultured Sulfurovum sp. TaxID=269237 RepID=A0A6S6RW55_9BACT|nr:MAG: Peptide methionine sulfoxide reductase MsrB (EC / Peptide methionine sulfoxide reductase MsrA (EC [uncultured Sulfurovum sp.]
MRKLLLVLSLLSIQFVNAQEVKPWAAALKDLTKQEHDVIVNKGTERPYTGKHLNNKEKGVYTCKVCNTPLYKSDDKFNSNCGWPSFDDEIKGAIKHKKDADGRRTEILCAKCDAHLGHVFKGEGMTAKNTRHCVNSISLNFEKNETKEKVKEVAKKDKLSRAYFAGGCFWGVEYHLEAIKGVEDAISGYMGGSTKNPSYYDVIRKNTGHLETVEVVYDPKVVSYETLAKAFFEIHDPTQTNGQGPDIGSQYLSAIFVKSPEEKKTIQKLITILEDKGLKVATKIIDGDVFYKAEDNHQDYYENKGSKPYCHAYRKRF